MSATVLQTATPPPGPWRVPTSWSISSLDELTRIRRAAALFTGERAAPEAEDPFLTSASARLELVIGELLANGLRHGQPPVQVTISRGQQGWLVVVADSAAQTPPRLPIPAPNTAGGLGLRLVLAMAQTAGWFQDGTRKHVWALVGDSPPDHLLAELGPA